MIELLLAAHIVYVVDGDTIKVDGVSYRMVDYNTPELYHANCTAEFFLASVARKAIQLYVEEPTATIRVEPCVGSNFGRSCGRLLVNGLSVARKMVSARLAEEYSCTIGKGCVKRRAWCSKS